MNRQLQLERDFVQALFRDGLIRPGERILVALSGGADSVALLHLLLRVAPQYELQLAAAHLDHSIRATSAADAAFVRALCARLGVELIVERRDVPGLAAQGKIGLEEAGREARLAFLQEAAERLGCASIALGHHRGDQAETVLHHLARGCAVSGLAGMRPRSGRIIRPLLDFSREQLRDYLAELGEGFVEDESNSDRAYTRNRIRHELLPALATFNPQIEIALATLAHCAAQDEVYWDGEVARLLPTLAQRDMEGWRLMIAPLLALHPALRARLLRFLLIELATLAHKEISFRHLELVEELLTSATPQGERSLPGIWAARRYDQLWLRTQRPSAPEGWQLAIPGVGVYPLPCGGVLRVALVATETLAPDAIAFDAASVAFPLVVRPILPGDRIRLPGLDGRKRIKELLMECRVPSEERQRTLVVENEEILWLVNLRRCAGSLPQPGSTALRLSLEPG